MESWRSSPDPPKADDGAAPVAHSPGSVRGHLALVEQWLNEQPDTNAKELLKRLQQADPTIADNLLRTLQRRVGKCVSRHAGCRKGNGHFVMGARPPNPRDLPRCERA